METLSMKNRSVPADIVLPHLVYRNVPQACEWLARVFGFTEHFRYGDPVSGVQMFLGEAYVMLHGPGQHSQSPATLGYGTQMITVFVADVDAHYRKTVEEGANVWEHLHETEYGERQYGVEDLDGHRWLFAQHARDVSPEEWGATIASPSA
jgi:uncharacterized glyoxalase superfamily protein PhnB